MFQVSYKKCSAQHKDHGDRKMAGLNGDTNGTTRVSVYTHCCSLQDKKYQQ
jgi:hypothetical protein